MELANKVTIFFPAQTLESNITVDHKNVIDYTPTVMVTSSMVLKFLNFAILKSLCDGRCTKELLSLLLMKGKFGVLFYVL